MKKWINLSLLYAALLGLCAVLHAAETVNTAKDTTTMSLARTRQRIADKQPVRVVLYDETDCVVSPHNNVPFDRLVIASQQERTQRALEHLVRPNAAPVHELLAPTWVPAQTRGTNDRE